MSHARRSIYVEGFGHGANPTPAACVGGGLLVSGALFGMDPATGKLLAGAQEQCARMFEIANAVLCSGGSSWAQVLKMTFYVAPDLQRQIINEHWLQRFPDPASRPARHVVVNSHLPPGMHVQCDLMALAEAG